MNFTKPIATGIFAALIAGGLYSSAIAQNNPNAKNYSGTNVYKKTNPNSDAGKGQKPGAAAAKKTRVAPSADKSRIGTRTSQSKNAPKGKKPTAAGAAKIKNLPVNQYTKPQDRKSKSGG